MTTDRLRMVGGEFACPAREAAFQAERLPETMRHACLVLGIAAVVNVIFLFSDWRFFGQPHFWVAMPARLGAIAISLLCLVAVRRMTTFAGVQRGLVVWEIVTASCVAVLCTSRSDLALFIIPVLPAIYCLVVPTGVRWMLACCTFTYLALITGYMLPEPRSDAMLGLVFAMMAAEAAIILFVMRWNRLRRLEWLASQAQSEANAHLADSRRLFETMFRAVPIPIVVSTRESGRIVSANDAALAYFEVADAAAFGSYVIRGNIGSDERREIAVRLARNELIHSLEVGLVKPNRDRHDVLLSVANVTIDGAPCTISSLVDITNRKAAEERIRIAAHHDTLTGLPNRAVFQATLEGRIADADAAGSRLGLILVDLDAFKEVNDTLGHEAGDALLKEVAQRLCRVVAAGDLVARLGGDEFVVLAAIDADGEDADARVHGLADAILDVLNPPMSVAGRVVSPRASLGLALFPDHAANGADLFTNADLALYAAKEAGRNRAARFVPALRAEIEARVTIAREMRATLQDGGLVPYYQPKIDLRSGSVVGFEALARWQHPRRGLLAPAAFATVFDDPEIGIAVGMCLIRQICADTAAWIAEGHECGRVFLNLSSAQFAQGDLVQTLLDAIDGVGLARTRIGIEVTETVLLGGHGDRVAPVLERLHAAGLGVALDDFGTGYASLTHLKQYPVDEIKVDRSFVRDLERDADDAAIVTAVLHLGRSLGLAVTAEGVETEAQAKFLAERGCDYAQGYLYSKPMAASRVPWFLGTMPHLVADDGLQPAKSA